ncbi:MAG: arginine--tRNA ligase [Patescibacteria group bacterium]|nr:arginine--tRNA ligase [Patescibacteria group bacterium]
MNLQEILKNNVVLKLSEDMNFPVKEVLYLRIAELIEDYLSEKTGGDINFVVECPTEESHGDYSTNIAMILAGLLKRKPLEIAEEISQKISLPDLIEKIEVVAPGFINFKIKQDYFVKELKEILTRKDIYGAFCNIDHEHPNKVMIEFGQPNTHKAFTVGHIKGTISGLSVSKLIENLGYQVVKTNYYGDIGMHTAKCTWGVIQKGLPKDFDDWDKHKKMEFIADAYVYATENFDENEEAIRKINLKIYKESKGKILDLYNKIKDWSREHQKAIFADLGVFYDVEYPESQVFAEAKKIIDKNLNSKLSAGQEGIFSESQGAIIYDGEKEGLNTWVMQTSEGNPTYSAKDLSLGFQKFEDYPDLYFNLTLTSIEQKDYFKAVIKILETLDDKFKNRYFHVPFGWLLMDGKKTSSRSGKNIKGTDILEESLNVARTKIAELKDYDEEKKEEISKAVASAGLKFLILSHEFNKNVNYDPKKFIDFEGYSGPYILYAYVRAKSILRKAEVENLTLDIKDFSLNEYELNLLKWLARYPQTTFRAGTEIAPQLLCVYLFELAQRFNSFYTNCPIIKASGDEKQFRLSLTAGTAQVLKNGLNLLGIETIEEM